MRGGNACRQAKPACKNMNDEKQTHSLSLVNRNLMELDGVTDVTSYDERKIVIETCMGILIIKGDELQITLLDISNKRLSISGHIRSMDYTNDKKEKKRGFLKKLFK